MPRQRVQKEYPLHQIRQKEHPDRRRRIDLDWWPVAFYNSGFHLYIFHPSVQPTSIPSHIHHQWLPFKQYCTGGNSNGVEFVHAGHVGRGGCMVNIQIDKLKFTFVVPPRQAIFVRETKRGVYIYLGTKLY